MKPFSNAQILAALKQCGDLADGGYLREAAWISLSVCQTYDKLWYLDLERVRMISFAMMALLRLEPAAYAGAASLIKHIDDALFASTAGVTIIPVDVLAHLNQARGDAWQFVGKRSPMPRQPTEALPT
jgi:hypothetical protein